MNNPDEKKSSNHDYKQEQDLEAPNGYECPITYEIMRDPVVAADGHSYEREGITQWLARGNHTSPLTGAKLAHRTLIPNHSLRKSITDFLVTRPILQQKQQEHRDLRLAIELREKEWADRLGKSGVSEQQSVDIDLVLDVLGNETIQTRQEQIQAIDQTLNEVKQGVAANRIKQALLQRGRQRLLKHSPLFQRHQRLQERDQTRQTQRATLKGKLQDLVHAEQWEEVGQASQQLKNMEATFAQQSLSDQKESKQLEIERQAKQTKLRASVEGTERFSRANSHLTAQVDVLLTERNEAAQGLISDLDTLKAQIENTQQHEIQRHHRFFYATQAPRPVVNEGKEMVPSREYKARVPQTPGEAKQLNQLLEYVAHGEQDPAEALIEMNPALLQMKGNVTDYSERTFRCITAFQYALWAKDWHMWTMIQKHLPREAQIAQLADWEAHPQHGGYFDFSPLLEAYQVYIDSYNNWHYDQRQHHWGTVIGGCQRRLPAHVVQEYMTPDRPFSPVPDFALHGRVSASRSLRLATWFTQSRGGVSSWVRGHHSAAMSCGARFGLFHHAVSLDRQVLVRMCDTRQSQLDGLRDDLSDSPRITPTL